MVERKGRDNYEVPNRSRLIFKDHFYPILEGIGVDLEWLGRPLGCVDVVREGPVGFVFFRVFQCRGLCVAQPRRYFSGEMIVSGRMTRFFSDVFSPFRFSFSERALW